MSTALANTKDLNPVKMAQMLETTSFEEMFRKVTVSLRSSCLLQSNLSVANPPRVKVTMSSDRTVYAYSVSILWSAYGIFIGATLSMPSWTCLPSC
ncbi:hypothetical protein ASPWEDRAFT_171893 [Aspergillus wentii DTO 134E9]|uniref:Uncharacterized protein n=1 Tax=Aspergillus wentii DTO 134E9 TaxID=1073089 RepID=A0A1L9RJH3_ASPWE|nr:uncharacterized protein ASPWEDRAFT_171893 [Aspergillus wentii DTO 134E9]KAI9931979.1 hypothetical protein MW887_009480 [Aspergillus wentii]OJJ35065.1 hypothetical protein ASPWEDRAFT_171893 [Aspergillus wentii DTO 134E9]